MWQADLAEALAAEVARQRLLILKQTPAATKSLEDILTKEMAQLFDQTISEVVSVVQQNQGSPALSEHKIRQAIKDQLPKMEQRIMPRLQKAADDGHPGAERALEVLQEKWGFGGSTQTSDAIMEALEEQAKAALDKLTDQATEGALDALQTAYDDGLGIKDIAKAVEDELVDFETWKLRQFARTEVNASQNLGAQRRMEELGVEYHQWIAAEDGRTRDSHAELNGQIARLDAPFSNGLSYPGDHSGPIEEWINCRCRLVPYIMPFGMQAPTGKDWFYEDEIIPVEDTGQGPDNTGAFHNKTEDEMRAEYDAWAKSLLAKEQKALKSYQGSGYVKINKDMRKYDGVSNSKAGQAKINTLKEMFKKPESHINDNVVAYRGTKLRDLQDPQVGGVISDKGFISSSIADGPAKSFAGGGGNKYLMEVLVPKGSPAVWMNSNPAGTLYPHEKELLLAPGQFQILEVNEVPSYGSSTIKMLKVMYQAAEEFLL